MNEPADDVFISCSKPQSTKVAEALERLITATTNLRVYLHESQFVPGPWLEPLLARIRRCKVHVLCINRQNIDAPWLLFEAALSSLNGLKAEEIPQDRKDCKLILVLDNTDLTHSPLNSARAKRLDAHDLPARQEFMQTFLQAIVDQCQAAGKADAGFAVSQKVKKARLQVFLQSLDAALKLPARPMLHAVGRDQFYEEMKKSIVHAKRLDLINLSPGEIVCESYRDYKRVVAQKIAENVPVRRIVAVNEIERLWELVGELKTSRGRVDFQVAMAHQDCYAETPLLCPLPASVQIVEHRNKRMEVFIVDPANGCHQRSQVTSTSFVIDHGEFATAASLYFDNWWGISHKENLVVKNDKGIHIQPLLDRLSHICEEVDGIPEQTVSDLRAEIHAINGAA